MRMTNLKSLRPMHSFTCHSRPAARSASSRFLLWSLVGLASIHASLASAGPYSGLWVGQVTLNRVNQVVVSLDAGNNPVAQDPNLASPASDAAHLRLILHVNGAGQVSLLKDVAVLNRVTGGGQTNIINLLEAGSVIDAGTPLLRAESDYALVTEERLYPEFPAQSAVRYASAVFDFGDSIATEALDAVLAAAATNAAQSVIDSTANFSTSAGRVAAENTAEAAALDSGNPGNAQRVVDNADVAADFANYLVASLGRGLVSDIATGEDNGSAALAEAESLRDQSFYWDTRAVELITTLTHLAASTNLTDEEKISRGQNIAASFADSSDDYQRFIAGKLFGDMLLSGAEEAAAAAVAANASAGSIRTAVRQNPTVLEATAEALRLKNAQYEDSRTTNAVNAVLEAIIGEAASALPAAAADEPDIRAAAEQAGRTALEDDVARVAIPPRLPTGDYNEFVRSDAFQESAVAAAEAAAEGAVFERANNALYTDQSIVNAARLAAFSALRDAYADASRAVRGDLPLSGTFGPGAGDPRLTWEIRRNDEAALGEAALTGTIYLPASHPTNPFRHRRHPDHTIGFDVKRNLRLDFDGQAGEVLPRAGFGVDRITGVYREEIFGLHKPLGQDPNENPIGLKVEGTFELNRISTIDTLNAR